jgi:hypothetical protein
MLFTLHFSAFTMNSPLFIPPFLQALVPDFASVKAADWLTAGLVEEINDHFPGPDDIGGRQW